MNFNFQQQSNSWQIMLGRILCSLRYVNKKVIWESQLFREKDKKINQTQKNTVKTLPVFVLGL